MTRRMTAMPPAAIVAVLCIGGATVSVMQSILIPLLTDLPAILGVSVEDVSWLVTATLLAGAIATPSLTRLADMYGKKRMMLVSLGMLLFGSLLAVASTSLWTLVIGRAFQGTASAVIAIGMSIMRDALPSERLNPSLALLSATLGIGGAFGLPMAGVMFGLFGWESVFWLSAVLAAGLIVAVVLVIPDSDVRTGGRFDFVGAVMLSAALFLLLLGITKGGTWGWGSQMTLGTFGASLLIFVLWVPWERRINDPLVDIRTTVNRPVLMTHVTAVLMGAVMYMNTLTTLQLLQLPTTTGYAFGLTPAFAGLLLVPAALMSLLIAPASARITHRFGARITLCVGALVMAGGYLFRLPFSSSLVSIVLAAIIVSVGTAIAFGALPTLLMAAVPITQTAAANGINTLARAAGAALASAAVAALLAGSTIVVGDRVFPSEQAFTGIFIMGGVLALIGAGLALTIPVNRPLFDAGGVEAELEAQVPVALLDDTEAKGHGRRHDMTRHGRVTDTDGIAIAGALVSVLDDAGAVIDWAHTDGDGVFPIALPAARTYRTLVSADGWHPGAAEVDFTDEDSWPVLQLLSDAVGQAAIHRRDALGD